jgi:carbamoyl-phosphate synthase large subunit
VRAFQRALAAVGGGAVIAADISPLAAALYEADGRRLTPRADDPSFVDALLAVCEQERVGLVVPTRDEELLLMARVRDRFAAAGTLVLVSPPDAIDTCRDKERFSIAVRDAGLDGPALYRDPAAAPLPAFVKPRSGKGGRGAIKVTTEREMHAALEALSGEALVQEFVDAPEFTVDVFLDLGGQPISCVPRERVSVVAGESVVGRTVRDPHLVAATLRLCTSIGLVGHVTVQAFRTPERIAFIEINPRYGGAANLGFEAGACTPEYAIRLARGEPVEPRLDDYEAGLIMLRYSSDRFIRETDLLAAEVAQ